MTEKQIMRAEMIAASIAAALAYGPANWCREYESCVDIDSLENLCGDQRRGLMAARNGDGPPDTVDGWAGWIAAHIDGWYVDGQAPS